MPIQSYRTVSSLFVTALVILTIFGFTLGSPQVAILSFFADPNRSPGSNPSPFIPTTINSNLYNNTNCGVTMQFPSDWPVERGQNEQQLNEIENVLVTARPPSDALNYLELALLDISNSAVYPTKSLEEVADFELSYIRDIGAGIDSIETTDITQLSGYPAQKVVYREDYQTLHNRIMKIWVVASAIAYQLTYQAPTENYTQYLPDVQKAIESIKLFTPTDCEVGGTTTNECNPAYPDVCITPDINCDDISARNFVVLPADPYGFDGDNDGIGCESGSSTASSRCPEGYHRSPSGDCERVANTTGMPR